MGSLLRRLGSTSVAKYGVSSLLPRGLAIVTAIVITPLAISKLGVTGYAFWVLATQVPSLVVSPDLGLTSGLVNVLGAVNQKDGNLRNAQARLFGVQRLLVGIALGWLVLGVIGSVAYAQVTESGSNQALLTTTLCTALAIFVLGIPPMVWTRAQLAQERGHEYVLAEGVGRVFTLVLSIAALLVVPSPVALVVAYLAPTVAASWWNAWRYKRQEFSTVPTRAARRPFLEVLRSESTLFRTGALFVLMQLAYVISTAIDPYIVGAFGSTDDVTFVNVTMKPFSSLPLTVTLFSTSLWPVFARLRGSGEYAKITRILLLILGGSSGIMVGISALFILLRTPLYSFLGAGHVEPSLTDLIACAAWVIASTVVTVLNNYLQAANLVKIQAAILFVGAIACLGLKILALEIGGITQYLVVAAAGYVVLVTVPLTLLTVLSLARSRRRR